MKTNTLKAAAAVGLSALLLGSAAAQDESVSKPVGYETINIDQQFNYMGLRLIGAPLATNAVVVTTDEGAGEMTIDNDTLEDGPVIVEVITGDAIGAVVEGSVDGGTISVPAELLGDLVADDTVTVRAPQTLASVFGDPIDGSVAGATTGLDGAAGFGAADLILVPDGSGGFDTYWYFLGGFGGAGAGWKVFNPDTEENDDVTASDVVLVYTDGLIIQNRGDSNSLVVSGSVKTTETAPSLTAQFNYLSTVYPAGATLSSAFDDPDMAGTLKPLGPIDGAAGAGAADLVFVPEGDGFKVYWYFTGGFGGAGATWKELDIATGVSTDVVSTDVSLDNASGIVIQNRGDLPQGISIGAPSFYADL